mgnify:CR=1 FL=1
MCSTAGCMRHNWHNIVDATAAKLAGWGISANMVSICGFIIGLLAINFLAMEMYATALLCILANRLCDALDGAIAVSYTHLTLPTKLEV